MSPNISPTKSEERYDARSNFLQQYRVGGVWEGLKLKHPLTRDEKEQVDCVLVCSFSE